MTNTVTKKTLRIDTWKNANPIMDVPLTQLDQVRTLFDTNKIEYWISENAVSFDGGPQWILLTLSYRSDPGLAQRLLDSVP